MPKGKVAKKVSQAAVKAEKKAKVKVGLPLLPA
jgi:hypothetical protein